MEEEQNAISQSNDGYTNAGVIALRLDTTPMLANIEAFLKGKRIGGYKETEHGIIPQFVTVGKPKMNDEGVQSIMTWLTPLFSPSTVQGNFPTTDELNNYLSLLELTLNDYVWKNRINWDIKIEEVDGIIDMIINVSEPFFSRLVGNKERDSYANTMISTQQTKVNDRNPFKLFGNS